MISPADGALGLYGAVGDACAGRRFGFARRRANLAARFARHRGADAVTASGSWYAGLLAETGLAAIAVSPDASEQQRRLLCADFPLHSAWLAAAIDGLPHGTADTIRWHREHDDGTGFPDALRWDGIPAHAAGLGIVNAFLEALDEGDEPVSPAEAAFGLAAESGRRFGVAHLRAFRSYVAASGDDGSATFEPEPAATGDDLLARLCARIDGREAQTEGRSERRAALAGPLSERLGIDRTRAERLARLGALTDLAPPGAGASGDPVERAAQILAAVPAYAADAPLLAASAALYAEGSTT